MNTGYEAWMTDSTVNTWGTTLAGSGSVYRERFAVTALTTRSSGSKRAQHQRRRWAADLANVLHSARPRRTTRPGTRSLVGNDAPPIGERGATEVGDELSVRLWQSPTPHGPGTG